MAFKTSRVGDALLAEYHQDPRYLMALQQMQQGSSTAPVQSAGEGIARALQAPLAAYTAKKMGEQYQAKQGEQYGSIADILAPKMEAETVKADLGPLGTLDASTPEHANPNRDKIMAALQSGLLSPSAVAPSVAESLGFGGAKEGFTLSEGQQRFDANGKPIATVAKSNNPNQPFNSDGTPNAAYQAYEAQKTSASQAPQWANVGLARERLNFERSKPAGSAAPPGYKSNPDGSMTYIPGGPADPTRGAGKKAPTEDQAKNAQLYTLSGKMIPQVLDNFESLASPGNQLGRAVSGIPLIGPSDAAVTSSGYQQANNGINSIVANFLYSTSGATATPDEVKKRAATVMPKFGDSAENVASKKQALIDMVDSIRMRATPGTPAYQYKPKQEANKSDRQTDELLKKYGVGGS